jgi:hypothetical protein
MNTSALKAFAPAVRKQLIEAVSRKLDFALTARTPDYLDTYATQVRSLRELATADREGLIERVAYTWFNRLAALRYLDARNWHPFHVKVLMAASAADSLPELFTIARLGAVPEELRRYIDVGRIEALLQGRIPSDDPQGEVYRLLVLAACRFYNEILPDVFERLDDETELLLPDDLLTEQSVVEGFRTEITDDDCEQVEVLGWLYQFYISEKKDEVMKRKAAVPAEDIPAVTQLFTPHWIVRYLVENSLGRLWLLNRPESLLKAWMPYYIESAEPETEFLRIERPQDIRLCDPAAGSGHMLTYAFDLLYVIYEEEGYAPSDIPALILRHNLTGIEIDARAAQLAALALTLKGREKSPRFFQQQHVVRPNIVELRDIRFAEGELLGYSEALGLGGLFTPPILQLMHQFEEAKNFGSLIQPCVGEADIAFARGSVEARDLGSNLFLNETHKKVLRLLEQAEVLTQRYQVVVANPPYMGNGAMNPTLKRFLNDLYPDAAAESANCFVLRNISLVLRDGQIAMITFHNWMFVSTFSEFRRSVLHLAPISTFLHNGRGVWGPDFGSCAFCMTKDAGTSEHGIFIRLFDKSSHVQSNEALSMRFLERRTSDSFSRSSASFSRVPGAPLAYWISDRMAETFAEFPAMSTVSLPKTGLSTGDKEMFCRQWYEVQLDSIRYGCTNHEDFLSLGSTGKLWAPLVSGGPYRKWYGNLNEVIDWTEGGQHVKSFLGSTIRNPTFYFREGITWSDVTISSTSFRYVPNGFVVSDTGPMAFCTHSEQLPGLLALCNSSYVERVAKALNPTVHFKTGDFGRIPVAHPGTQSDRLVEECVSKARQDWNNFETSWDFSDHPLLRPTIKAGSIGVSWRNWSAFTTSAIARMQELEGENNRLFISAYGLQDELTPDVPEDQITLARPNDKRDMAGFISYVVGCMMGRYSLDKPGLILANAGHGLPEYVAKVGRAPEELTFQPDRDGIVPMLDDEWFADDIVTRTREFLKATFGEAMLRDNIRFIEESLGRGLRSYFLADFYKDHLQTYKKRPIYWMVQSPRKGFSVLIYLHRYTRDTMNVILNRYLREFQVKLRSKIDHLQQVSSGSSASVREKSAAAKEAAKLTKTLHECEEWERQTILPLAQARIELDLDDGVKVNYQKLGEALVKIPGFEAAEE